MPISRAVPRAPMLSHLHRRLAHLPLGGPTGIACTAAGVACAISLVVVHPQVNMPLPFDLGDDRPPATLSSEAPARTEVIRVVSVGPVHTRITISAGGSKGSPTGGAGGPAPTPAATDKHEPQPAPSASPMTTPTAGEPAAEDEGAISSNEDRRDQDERSDRRDEDDQRDEHRDEGGPGHDERADGEASNEDDVGADPNEPAVAS